MINKSKQQQIKNYLYDNHVILLIFAIIFFISFYYVSEKIVLLMILFSMLFYFKNDFIDDIEKHSPQSNQNIIENNRRRKEQINFHSSIQPIVDELSHYKKYNPSSYKDGLKNIQLFSLLLSDLEKDKIYHWTQYFENAKYYLTKSVNNFQSIGISVPEENLNQALKYNKFEPTKLGNRVGKLCKRLNKHCYYLLYNLSLRLNESWIKDPDIYKDQIAINYQNVEPLNHIDFNWSLY